MTSNLMTQCLFERKKGNKTVQYTAWIPSEKAKKNRTVNIKGHGEWRIKEVFRTDDARDVIENSTNYKRHRKATDI